MLSPHWVCGIECRIHPFLEGVASWRRATDYYGLRWWVLKSTQNMLRGITVSPVVCISVADES